MKKELFKKFNTQDAVIVISPYPKQGEVYSAGASGIASYAKNVVSHMKNKVIVLADYAEEPIIYEEKNVLVVRCFKKNSPLMWVQITKELSQLNLIRNILIQFDFALYGSTLTSGLIIPFLTYLKLRRYTTSFVMHSVIEDILKLHGHVGLNLNKKTDFIKGKLFNFVFHSFYTIAGLLVKNIIVLEEPLKTILAEFVPAKKITTIPHGVDHELKEMNKIQARKELGIPNDEHIVLFFGYVNWFKGADFFAKAFQNRPEILGKKVHHIIAGGRSSTMKAHTCYKSFFAEVMQYVCDTPHIQMTGYVPQKDIKKYFAAADIVVFPYRYFMNASGVLSLTFSYRKPFIVANTIAHMFDSPDFKEAFKAVGLTKQDITFNLNDKSLVKQTEKVLKNGLKKKMVDAATIIREKRQYAYTALHYENVLFKPDFEAVVKPAYNYIYAFSSSVKRNTNNAINALRSIIA